MRATQSLLEGENKTETHNYGQNRQDFKELDRNNRASAIHNKDGKRTMLKIEGYEIKEQINESSNSPGSFVKTLTRAIFYWNQKAVELKLLILVFRAIARNPQLLEPQRYKKCYSLCFTGTTIMNAVRYRCNYFFSKALCIKTNLLLFENKDFLKLIHFDRHRDLPGYVKCDRLKLRLN